MQLSIQVVPTQSVTAMFFLDHYTQCKLAEAMQVQVHVTVEGAQAIAKIGQIDNCECNALRRSTSHDVGTMSMWFWIFYG